MVNLIVDKIVEELESLVFIDRITGMVKHAMVSDANGNVKTFPVALNLDVSKCNDSELLDYVPDSSKTSIIYFEDKGTTMRGMSGGYIDFTANFVLVCWYNFKKINKTMTNTSYIAANLIKALPIGNMGNISPLIGVFLEVTGQQANDGAIFAPYSYKQEISQYITYPYDYVALNLRADFRVRPECVDDITLNTTKC